MAKDVKEVVTEDAVVAETTTDTPATESAATDAPVMETQVVEESVAESAAEEAPVSDRGLPSSYTPIDELPYVEKEGVVAETPVIAEPAAAPEEAPVDPTAPAAALPHNPELDEYSTPEEGQVIAQIKEYIQEMRPGKSVSAAKAVQQHQQLYRAITRCIERFGDDFDSCFAKINKLFLKHSETVFHDDYAFRFLKHMKMSDADVKQYINLIHVIRIMCDPKARQVSQSHVDLATALAGLSERGRGRVMYFYGK